MDRFTTQQEQSNEGRITYKVQHNQCIHPSFVVVVTISKQRKMWLIWYAIQYKYTVLCKLLRYIILMRKGFAKTVDIVFLPLLIVLVSIPCTLTRVCVCVVCIVFAPKMWPDEFNLIESNRINPFRRCWRCWHSRPSHYHTRLPRPPRFRPESRSTLGASPNLLRRRRTQILSFWLLCW